ncbi:MAG: FGGY family carbohydrate kinase [Propionibacteriaceae bacterium]|nr:FGGY family carbohydrate kinase [Propionibacteriaceae bacterium]
MTTSVLAIDQGTSSTKAVVVDGQGAVRGLAEVGLRPQYKAGGLVEQDPRELMDSVRQAGREALDKAGIPVDGVALTNQGETVLAWDPATGEPLTTMLVWQDGRAATVCNRLADQADMVAQRTGLVLDPYFSAPKMAWLRENQTRDGVVTTSDSWIIHQLSREFVTDAATAGRSLITCLDTAEYDTELLELFGLGDERLPVIVPNDQVIGTTNTFGPDLPLGGLIVDQQGALLAEHCLEAGEAKCTFGTGAFFLTNLGRQPARSSNGLVSCVAWSVDGQTTYCSDGQVLTAASAVRWLQDIGLIAGPADLDQLWKDDTGGVVCVPALAGLAAPWWRPDAGAVWQGMTLSTSREDLVSAMVQGLAAQVAELSDLVAKDMGQPLTRLRVDGGLTRSRRFMQAVADLTQLPIDVYPSAHATPLGAAALMRKALEPGLTLPDAIVQWEASDCYEPAWSTDRAEEFRSTWRRAVDVSLGDGVK